MTTPSLAPKPAEKMPLAEAWAVTGGTALGIPVAAAVLAAHAALVPVAIVGGVISLVCFAANPKKFAANTATAAKFLGTAFKTAANSSKKPLKDLDHTLSTGEGAAPPVTQNSKPKGEHKGLFRIIAGKTSPDNSSKPPISPVNKPK